MCELVAHGLEHKVHTAVEAGTGVGKGLAYLVPAVLHRRTGGGLVIVSTATKQLQDQLRDSDVPRLAKRFRPWFRLRRMWRKPLRYEILKGRHNYLCQLRYSKLCADPQQMGFAGMTGAGGASDGAAQQQLVELHTWAATTATGDRAELEVVPNEGLWRAVSATSSECPGAGACEFGLTCFAETARARAAIADVAIVNHALYITDMLNEGNVLPEHSAVVFDEVHALGEMVDSSAGFDVSEQSFSDLITPQQEAALDLRGAKRFLTETGGMVAEALLQQKSRERNHQAPAGGDDHSLNHVLDSAHERLERVRNRLWDSPETQSPTSEHAMLDRSIGVLQHQLRGLRDGDVEGRTAMVQYVAGADHEPSLQTSPLDVASFMQAHLLDGVTAVMTSATVGAALPPALGFGDDCYYEVVESSFDYRKNARLYIATRVAEPNHEDETRHLEGAAAEMEALIGEIGGRTLVLCTSYRAINYYYEYLAQRSEAMGTTVYRQVRRGGDGSLSNAELLERLRADRSTVLVATLSFWQGIDVPGEALQLLIVDKPPFKVPSDPLYQARSAEITRRGGDPFTELSVPHAARLLAQGLGRLIRTATDRGVAVVLDARVVSRRYGPAVLESVPPMTRTYDRNEAITFLRYLRRPRRLRKPRRFAWLRRLGDWFRRLIRRC